MEKLQVLDIIPGTTVDGPGLRTTIYFAGCPHHCAGCHNPQSWDPSGGKPMAINDLIEIIEENGFNVTFSGGDPLMQIEPLLGLAEKLQARGYTIWCYTGYCYEQIVASPSLKRILDYIEVLVDGQFIESLRDISLHFRGSSNQRLISVAESVNAATPILWEQTTTPSEI